MSRVRVSTPSRAPTPSRAVAAQRPIGLPRPLRVRVDGHGLPCAVLRTGPRTALGGVRANQAVEAAVLSVQEVWRVAEAWWREAPQARTYARVILEGGRPLTLFRDDERGEWFEQRYER
ncbi:MAG: hypothetical protein WD058_02790 [Dehalococcoidia bacterium]